MHPSHQDQIKRLNKIEGQIKGVRKMIEDQRYCVDILSQLKAVMAALKKVEMSVLETHLRHCVKETMESQDAMQIQEKIEEIMMLISKQRS